MSFGLEVVVVVMKHNLLSCVLYANHRLCHFLYYLSVDMSCTTPGCAEPLVGRAQRCEWCKKQRRNQRRRKRRGSALNKEDGLEAAANNGSVAAGARHKKSVQLVTEAAAERKVSSRDTVINRRIVEEKNRHGRRHKDHGRGRGNDRANGNRAPHASTHAANE